MSTFENPSFDKHAHGQWIATLGAPRDQVRQVVVQRQLRQHLPAPANEATILDIGPGQGDQAIGLARVGYNVVGLDASDEMIGIFRGRLAQTPNLKGRVGVKKGYGENVVERFGEEAFDAVLCHGVLAYADEPGEMLQAMSRVAKPGAPISLLTISREVGQMRAAEAAVSEGNPGSALRMLSSEDGVAMIERSGVPCKAFGRVALGRLLEENGLEEVAWYGVRTTTDNLPSEISDDNVAVAVELDMHAGAVDPWRQYAPFVHTICRTRHS